MSVFFKSGGSSSSAGQGVINLVTNGIAANQAVNPFTTYANTPGTVPVSGTGGTPTGVTAGITTTTPLIPPRSFTFSKSSGNQQGQGFSLVFPVELAYRGKSMEISVEYIIQSGTFNAGTLTTDSDITWYVYDITNSQLIYPTNVKMFSNSSSISDTFVGTFQTSATGASYRLIAHVGTTNTTDFVMALDYVTVTPNVNVNGASIQGTQSYTPTGTWTGVTYTGFYNVVGDTVNLTINGTFTSVSASGTLEVSLPPGLVVDQAKIAGGLAARIGKAILNDNGVTAYIADVGPAVSTNMLRVFAVTVSGANVNAPSGVTPTSPFTFGVGDSFVVQALNLPVVGFSASTRQSDGFSSRNIIGVFSRDTNQNIATTTITKVALDTTSIDTTASFDSANNRWLAPASDYYEISGQVEIASGTVSEIFLGEIRVNSTTFTQTFLPADSTGGAFIPIPSRVIFVTAGQAVELYAKSSADTNYNVQGYLSITRVQSPQTISASDEVSLIANTTSAQNNQTGTAIIVAYNTRELDTFNMLNTSNGIMTAPVTGRYFIDAQAEFATNVTGLRVLRIYVGSSFFSGGEVFQALTSNATAVRASAAANLTAGQTFSIQCFQSSGVTLALTNSAIANRISVWRITQ